VLGGAVFESERVLKKLLAVVGEGQLGAGWRCDALRFAATENNAAC